MKRLIIIILIIAMTVPASASVYEKGGTSHATVFGKWTLYFDAREYNKTSLYPTDFDVQSLDLYIYENGSCYMSTMQIKNGQLTPPNTISGIWIGDDQNITMQYGDLTYKAYIDYVGTLHLQALSANFKMIRVESIDPMTYFD